MFYHLNTVIDSFNVILLTLDIESTGALEFYVKNISEDLTSDGDHLGLQMTFLQSLMGFNRIRISSYMNSIPVTCSNWISGK